MRGEVRGVDLAEERRHFCQMGPRRALGASLLMAAGARRPKNDPPALHRLRRSVGVDWRKRGLHWTVGRFLESTERHAQDETTEAEPGQDPQYDFTHRGSLLQN